MARFTSRATQPARGPADLLRWRMQRFKRPILKDPCPEFIAPSRPNDGSQLLSLDASLTWIGHASFLLRLGSKFIAIDPMFSSRISGIIPRLVPPGLSPPLLPPIDLVLISHNHRDHLDLPSLRQLGPSALYLVPVGNAGLLRSEGLDRIIELDWWESFKTDTLEITLVPARHWSMRMPWDRNEMLWGGYIIRSAQGVAYHSGDTGFFDGFSEIRDKCGPIDWAMLPIGAYEPRWFMQPQHMDPEDASRAFALLQARNFVAMHWGTFRLTDEPICEPPALIRSIWENQGRDPSQLWLMEIGETRALF